VFVLVLAVETTVGSPVVLMGWLISWASKAASRRGCWFPIR
jgi:hypothetical protein